MTLGDRVRWSGLHGPLTGRIVAVVPAGTYPPVEAICRAWDAQPGVSGAPVVRDHESFLVLVGRTVAWPVVARLRLVPEQQQSSSPGDRPAA